MKMNQMQGKFNKIRNAINVHFVNFFFSYLSKKFIVILPVNMKIKFNNSFACFC